MRVDGKGDQRCPREVKQEYLVAEEELGVHPHAAGTVTEPLWGLLLPKAQ